MDYPMTAFEVWKHLLIIGQAKEESKKYQLEEVIKCLNDPRELFNKVASQDGLYFLRGRENLVRERIKREKISAQKIKRLFKIVRYLRIVPFIQFIGATGRVAMKNAKASSDLDLLIVFNQGKIFSGRFLVFLMLQIMGKRRHGKKISNRVCLNHFLVFGAKPQVQDIFSAHEYSFMLPVFYSKNSVFAWQESFSWVEQYLPNHVFTKKNSKTLPDVGLARAVRVFLELLLRANFWEKILKNIQIKKINNNTESHNKQGVLIVTDQELAFWPEFEKQGPRIWEKFAKKFDQIPVDEL